MRVYVQADKRDLAAFEKRSAEERSRGLFFKGLYSVKEEEEQQKGEAQEGGRKWQDLEVCVCVCFSTVHREGGGGGGGAEWGSARRRPQVAGSCSVCVCVCVCVRLHWNYALGTRSYRGVMEELWGTAYSRPEVVG